MAEPMGHRVALINLGCRVNRVETDLIASRIEEAGCVLVDCDQAELVIVNTCAVTGEAQVKTRKAVRRAARMPQSPIVVATGCAATLFSSELEKISPRVVVEPRKDRVAQRAIERLGITNGTCSPKSHLAISPTPTGRTRPGIKIQDGCDLRCSYCIVWKARGPSRSLPSKDVLNAVRESIGRGAHEVVLTGINLGCYRTTESDALGPNHRLEDLLECILRETTIDRIRISSIEPQDVTEPLLETMSNAHGRIAPFLHVCLQSGCDETLRRMGRTYTTNQFSKVVADARRLVPDIALETDVIVGFPGETDEEFAQSLAFCERMAFSRIHAFRYSKRPGTPAAVAPCQVDPNVSAIRSQQLRTLAERMRKRHMQERHGAVDMVLVQERGDGVDSHLLPVQMDDELPLGSWVRARLGWQDGVLVGTTL